MHGNSKKKERAPDGSPDQNVFDIMQGVSIAIMIRKPGMAGERKSVVRHADLWGLRKEKEVVLNAASLASIAWEELSLNAPSYLFVPQEQAVREEYEKGWSVKDISPVNVLGFQTHRDNFAIAFDEATTRNRIEAMRDGNISGDTIKTTFSVSDNRDWQVASVRHRLRNDAEWEKPFLTCAYRPFDERSCYFSEVTMDYPRRELLNHVAGRDNLVLNLVRQTREAEWHHSLITNKPAPAVFLEIKEGSSAFPLYLYPTAANLFDAPNAERRPNLSPDFLEALRSALTNGQEPDTGDPTKNNPTPEAIFHYLYAVLHAPTYRTRYAEFLKRDFPRVPLPPSRAVFDQAAQIGAKLVALHLLEDPTLQTHGIGYPVAGDHTVQKMRVGDRYSPAAQRVHLNAVEYFDHVPQEAWEFRVGGYQPAAKWLDDRANRALTEDDIRHYRRMIAALRETARLLPDADAVFAQILAGPSLSEGQ